MLYLEEYFTIPSDLSEKGQQAAQLIKDYAKKKDVYTGGCPTFRHPQKWDYANLGKNIVLVVIYEGSELAKYFALDRAENQYKSLDYMTKELKKLGLYSEEGTCWYSVIVEDQQ